MAMSFSRLQPPRDTRLAGTSPIRQSVVLGNLTPVRSPQPPRLSLSVGTPVKNMQTLSPGAVASTRVRSPRPNATGVFAEASPISAPRLVQSPQLNPRTFALQAERQKAEERMRQEAELLQSSYNKAETTLLLEHAEADVRRQEEAERLQHEQMLDQQQQQQQEQEQQHQQEAHLIRKERDERDALRSPYERQVAADVRRQEEAQRLQHGAEQRMELERAFAWQHQEAERMRSEEAAHLERQRKRLSGQQQYELQSQQHQYQEEQEVECLDNQEKELTSSLAYERQVARQIQEAMGVEKEYLVEDTDCQLSVVNGDSTRMQMVAAMLKYQVGALKSRAKDPKVQVTAASAAAGGVALGAAGAGAGAVVGGVVGAGAGLPAALFTFGLSIPIAAALGAGAGLGVGATAGGTVGAIGGGAAGCQIYNYRASATSEKELSTISIMGAPDIVNQLDTNVAGA